MSGIINQIGARSGIISGGRSASAGTVTLSGITGLDYEEGTWTPVFVPDSGSFTSVTYNTSLHKGLYIKVGKVVHIQCYTRTNAITVGSASGYIYVSGLPYTSGTTRCGIAVASAQNFNAHPPSHAYVSESETKLFLLSRDNTTSDTYTLVVGDLGTSTSDNIVSVGGTYMIA